MIHRLRDGFNTCDTVTGVFPLGLVGRDAGLGQVLVQLQHPLDERDHLDVPGFVGFIIWGLSPFVSVPFLFDTLVFSGIRCSSRCVLYAACCVLRPRLPRFGFRPRSAASRQRSAIASVRRRDLALDGNPLSGSAIHRSAFIVHCYMGRSCRARCWPWAGPCATSASARRTRRSCRGRLRRFHNMGVVPFRLRSGAEGNPSSTPPFIVPRSSFIAMWGGLFGRGPGLGQVFVQLQYLLDQRNHLLGPGFVGFIIWGLSPFVPFRPP